MVKDRDIPPNLGQMASMVSICVDYFLHTSASGRGEVFLCLLAGWAG